jgi:hypothetical protein
MIENGIVSDKVVLFHETTQYCDGETLSPPQLLARCYEKNA